MLDVLLETIRLLGHGAEGHSQKERDNRKSFFHSALILHPVGDKNIGLSFNLRVAI